MADGSNQVPAGWYGDPQNPNQRRYWDGTQWTGHTQPLLDSPPPTPAVPPPAAPPAPAPLYPTAVEPASGLSTGAKVLLVLGGVMVLLLGGCTLLVVAAGRGLEEAVEQANTEIQEVVDEASAQTAQGEAGDDAGGVVGTVVDGTGGPTLGTRDDPLPFSVPIELAWESFGDADGSRWTTTIGPHRDITDAVLAENPFNEAPPDDVRFVGFDVEMTLVSSTKEPLSPGFNFTWEVLGGATNAAYDPVTIETDSFGCGVVPDAFDDFSEVFVGGTLNGTVCIPLPTTDLDHPATRVAMHFADDSRAIFGAP